MFAALVTASLVTACTPTVTPAPEQPDAATGRVVAGSLHGRSGAYLIVRGAASRIEVRLADLPGLLYRVSTPANSGLSPRVTGGEGMVRVGLRPTGDSGPDTVLILLNHRVRWDIGLPSGGGEQHLDLAAGKVARVALGSSGLVEVTLPRPAGTVPVLLSGAVGDATFGGFGPVRFNLRHGAGSVRTPWTATDGSPAGTVLVQPGWAGATDRYTVFARARVGRLAVTTRLSPAAG